MKKYLVLGLLLTVGSAQADKPKPFTPHAQKKKNIKLLPVALEQARLAIGDRIGYQIGLKASGHSAAEIKLQTPKFMANFEPSLKKRLLKKGYSQAEINRIITLWSHSNTPALYEQTLIKAGFPKHKAKHTVQTMIAKYKKEASEEIQKFKVEKQLMNIALALSRQTISYTIGLRIGLKASGHTDAQIKHIINQPTYLPSFEASMIEKLQKKFSNQDINKIVAIWADSNTPTLYKKTLMRHGYDKHHADLIVQSIIKTAETQAYAALKKKGIHKKHHIKHKQHRAKHHGHGAQHKKHKLPRA